jgi:hypothetical protein
MEKRNISGVYFRCQEKDGSWGNRVFEDLSEAEQDKVLEGRDSEWLKSMVKNLSGTIRKIGDQFDMVAVIEDEDNAPEKAMMSREFEKNDWDHMHDCILDATHETDALSLSQEELETLFMELPREMRMDAFSHGMNDTPWRDNLYEWYQKNRI